MLNYSLRKMNTTSKNSVLAIAYFLLATLLTGLFIANKFWLYNSTGAMLASGCIAAGKWMVQIVTALILLNHRKWEFIKRMAWVSLIGSGTLFSYNLMGFLHLPISGFSQFVIAIVLAVVVMIFLYYQAVKKTELQLEWFWGWIICLLVAITLQLTVIF